MFFVEFLTPFILIVIHFLILILDISNISSVSEKSVVSGTLLERIASFSPGKTNDTLIMHRIKIPTRTSLEEKSLISKALILKTTKGRIA